MRSITTLLFLTVLNMSTLANVNYIDISKISNDHQLVTAFNFIKDNKHYYDHWTEQWNYDKPKQDLIPQLREYYKLFWALPAKNAETFLLLGDIAHYLYNMDDSTFNTNEFNEQALYNYKKAIQENASDYRGHWFLGNHYALSAIAPLAIRSFMEAEKHLPTPEPADFWNDYAMTTAIINMPSHCIYAMDKVKSILGKQGSFQQNLGENIYKRIIPMDKNTSYKKEDIWFTNQDDKISFISRPLGIKILVDSTWDLQIYDYQRRQGIFIMNPPTIANKKGRKIGYTMGLFMKTVDDKDNLEDYVKPFASKYSDKKQIHFSDKYEKMVAYEMKDKSMYQDAGGGHLYIVGIERNAPKYPGLLLENPVSLPQQNSEKINYYRATASKDRFKGKIFYLFLLDSCEDIYEKAFANFKSLFEYQIIIE